jgi:5S rRNA maturation endonuclease (ribonuclease M5)
VGLKSSLPVLKMRRRRRERKTSPSLLEKQKQAALLLEKLIERSNEGCVILVEGLKDAAALRLLGVQGYIACIKPLRIPLYDYLQRYIDSKVEIVILTDFDRRGSQLLGKIASYLEHSGKHPNLSFWMKLNSLLSGDVKDVEGLPAYLKNIKDELWILDKE